jgi:Flp pilus assembly protein TadD
MKALIMIVLLIVGLAWLGMTMSLSGYGDAELQGSLARSQQLEFAESVADDSSRDGSPRLSASEAARTEGVSANSEPAAPGLVDLRKNIDRPALAELESQFIAAVAAAPDDGALHVNLCEAARLLGNYDLAVTHGELSVALLPDDGRAHHQYAKALGEQMRVGGLFTAIRVVGTYTEQMLAAIRLDPDNYRARSEQIAFLLFMPSFGGGDKERAVELAKALEQDDARWGLLMQVLVLVDREDDLGAVALCERALERAPGDQRIAVTLAGLLDDLDRTDEANVQFQVVLAGPRGEAYYLALYQQARMHIRAGLFLQDSILTLEEYISVEPYGEFLPSISGAHYRMGTAWEQLGDEAAARRAYETALELDPDNDKAEDALDEL